MWRRVRMSSRKEFQFTPLREGRQSESEQAQLNPDFNSRPSARGDAYVGREIISNRNFNSRPSARGDNGFNSVLV